MKYVLKGLASRKGLVLESCIEVFVYYFKIFPLWSIVNFLDFYCLIFLQFHHKIQVSVNWILYVNLFLHCLYWSTRVVLNDCCLVAICNLSLFYWVKYTWCYLVLTLKCELNYRLLFILKMYVWTSLFLGIELHRYF